MTADDRFHPDTGRYRPRVQSQADLERVWRFLLQPLGFDHDSLWLLLVAPDDRVQPMVHEIEELDRLPDPGAALQLGLFLRALLDESCPGGRVALLRSRPGRHGLDAEDRAWAGVLYDTCRSTGVATEVVHVATDLAVLPVPLDELTLPAA